MRRVLALAVLAASASCASSRPALRAPALVGKAVDVAAEDLSGRTVRLATDGRVRVVDFWATWCEPCQEQLPRLDALARRYGDAGLAVAAVSFDEDRALLEAFVAEHPVSFPVLWDRGGARLSEPLDVQRLPTTLVLDRRGIVRHVHVGYDAPAGERLEREIRELLAEPAPVR
ncbi:TlpA family protein disulfide reductase [Anaeromyxobacter oryzisoli]|jgi:cytochrome c biogenesis protein CcmG, thiol:disulfide interchange protein DsbE|uniref:TlpA family protein disulfide reductase n=1 Tax=Anaeromyxobacter oryzisoli TaxID=2925408 RepID=UPI001F5AA2F2|nr:TlpA disulfide reductase family protein [Anaeromyxobacter sp. SG63]